MRGAALLQVGEAHAAGGDAMEPRRRALERETGQAGGMRWRPSVGAECTTDMSSAGVVTVVPVLYARGGSHTFASERGGHARGRAGRVRSLSGCRAERHALRRRTRAALTIEHARAARRCGRRELAPHEREAARRAAALQHAAARRRSAGQLVSAPVGRGAAASAASVGGPCRGASGRATARARRIRKRRTSGRREKAARARAGSRKRCWAKCRVGADNW